MSIREDLNIQADDLTIIQGEKSKDYNVIVTSPTGSPLESIPLTIGFYNNDYSFVNDAVTNEYGIATVPIYLAGDSYFVDVHFKGDEYYKPQVVTKEIIIDKFEQLETTIQSYGTDLTSDGALYTIHLADSNGLPVQYSYVRVEIDDELDLLLKTNNAGNVIVPYRVDSGDKWITTTFIGNARYKGTTHNDLISFGEESNKSSKEFKVTYDGVTPIIQWRTVGGEWENFFTTSAFPQRINKFKIVINNQDDDYWYMFFNDAMEIREMIINDFIYDGIFPLNVGNYNITIYYSGDEHYKCCTETLELTYEEDHRTLAITQLHMNLNGDVGELIHKEVEYGSLFGDGDTDVYIGVGASNSNNSTLTQLIEDSDYVIKCNTKNVDMVYGFDFYCIVPSNKKIQIFNESSFYSPYVNRITINGSDNGDEDVTLTQNGFAYHSQTYQSIDILVQNQNAEMHDKVGEYYVMRLLNTDTREEFYFYSYLIDNVTVSHIDYLLTKGTWELYIVSKGATGYKGGYYVATETLTTDTIIEPTTDDIITKQENWINLGNDNPTFSNQTISTTTSDTEVHSIMAMEYTGSNYYILTFNETISGYDSAFIIGADPNSEELDGLFISPNNVKLYSNGILRDEMIFAEPIFKQSPLMSVVRVQRDGNKFTIFVDGEMVYKTDLISWNTFGVYQYLDQDDSECIWSSFKLEPYNATEITPSTQNYDGTIFGSNWHIEFREDHLNFTDYGMLPSGAVGGGLVLLDNVPLPKDTEWEMDITIDYNNKKFDARLNKLYGEIQARLFEDVSTSDSTLEYSKVLCSPVPIPNAKTIFTRHSDEGTLYYVKPNYLISDELDKVMQRPQYMCNPYIQYKGGVECYTETGISLFDLENQYSPVYIGNDLIRAEFHRRSGYIIISRYDENTDTWYTANILKIDDNLKLTMNEYNDDYASVSFGNTTWEFYRGRPFIVVKHPNADIRILKLVDRVYCETIENEQSMGFIEEHNTLMSTFAPQYSIQKFKQDMHIGENIRIDNFDLYEVDANGYLVDLEHSASLGTTIVDNDTALVVDKDFTGKLALNFPASSTYLKKTSDQFSLLIGNINVDTQTSITVKARGFDDNGAIPLVENVQYGLWEQSQTFTVSSSTTEIRATFTDCPTAVKYIDFVVIFNTATTSDIVMNKLMCYDGDSEPNWDVDVSIKNANNVQITFSETYYANLYNESSPVGLCIIRPNQKPLTLNKLYASDETVLAPYMKKSAEWDKPSQVFLEYLNANRQTIDIDWGEF